MQPDNTEPAGANGGLIGGGLYFTNEVKYTAPSLPPQGAAMFSDIDLTALPVAELVERAHTCGVRFHAHPHEQGRIVIHPHRDPAMLPLVTALRARREEMAAFLLAQRPPSPAISEEEAFYRRVVLGEPDIPLSELTWPVLAARIARIVFEVIDYERAAVAWEQEIAGRERVGIPLAESPKPTHNDTPVHPGRFSTRGAVRRG